MSEDQIEPGTLLPDIGYEGVLRAIPHRFPMLLIDKVQEIRAYGSAVGLKNVTFNEPFFQGHFPQDPIMPGVMIVEALAQTAAVLSVASLGPAAQGSLVYFMSVDEAKFRRPVRPGDQLRLEVELQRRKLSVWKYHGRATVDGQVATQCVFSAKVMAGG